LDRRSNNIVVGALALLAGIGFGLAALLEADAP